MIMSAEPMCVGHEHARVNAALLHAVRLAFPEKRLFFFAEPEHGRIVRAHLDSQGACDVAVVALPRIPNRHDVGLCSRADAFFFCGKLLHKARRLEARQVLLTAINTPLLFFLNLWLTVCYRELRVIGVAHSLMQNLTFSPPRLAPGRITLRKTLQRCSPSRLTIFVPGESIRQAAVARAPEIERCLQVLDFCYDFPTRVESSPGIPPMRFGFLGVGTRRKGIELFYRLADVVQQANPSGAVEFLVVGLLQDSPTGTEAKAPVFVPCPDRFLEPAEQNRLIARVHYAVFPYVATEYELVASAAFLDALAALKPVVALRNSYFAAQFERMGDIGYLCDTESEIIAVVKKLAQGHDENRYRQQQENLAAGRRFFEPDNQARLLRKILGP